MPRKKAEAATKELAGFRCDFNINSKPIKVYKYMDTVRKLTFRHVAGTDCQNGNVWKDCNHYNMKTRECQMGYSLREGWLTVESIKCGRHIIVLASEAWRAQPAVMYDAITGEIVYEDKNESENLFLLNRKQIDEFMAWESKCKETARAFETVRELQKHMQTEALKRIVSK